MVPVAAALLCLPLKRRGWLFVATAAGLLSLAAYLYTIRPFNNLLVFQYHDVPLLVLDGLSHLVLTGVALAALLYALYSVDEERAIPYALYLLATAAGVILAGELVTLMLFSLLLLDACGHLAMAGGKKIGLGEGLSLGLAAGLLAGGLAAMMLISHATAIHLTIRTYPLLVKAMVLSGFTLLAGVLPFHRWLVKTSNPLIYAAVNTVGLYGIFRFAFNVFGLGRSGMLVLTVLGLSSLVYGGLVAFARRDLAYNNIAQTGVVLAAAGLASPLALMGALFHLLNLIVIKPLLVYAGDTADRASGPLLSSCLVIGWLANAAIPPFNGFWSLHYVLLALAQQKAWPSALLLIPGLVIILALSLKVLKEKVFSAEPGGAPPVRWPQGTVLVISAVLCLLIGLNTGAVVTYLINPAVIALTNGTGYARMIAGVLL